MQRLMTGGTMRALLLVVMAAQAGSSAAQEGFDFLGGGNAPQVMHSTGLFTFTPPSGWQCDQMKDSSVRCQTNQRGAAASLVVTHKTIQGTLDSELMALNTEAELKKLPHYQRVGGGRFLLGTMKASVRSFTFDYQANTEYPIAVEEMYLVSGSKAIRIHFETMRGAMPAYAADLKTIYDSFGVADVDGLGAVLKPAELRNGRNKKSKNRGRQVDVETDLPEQR